MLCHRHEDRRIKAADELRETVRILSLFSFCFDTKSNTALFFFRQQQLQENYQKRILSVSQMISINDSLIGLMEMTTMRNWVQLLV